MNAGEARSIAERWVAEEVSRAAGEVLCVFTGGSVNRMADEEAFPPSSDLDLVIVVPEKDPERHRVCKHAYGGIAVEVCYRSQERFFTPDAVLADFALAEQLVTGKVLYDPEGSLGRLRQAVAAEFARRPRIRQRCRALRDEALSFLAHAEASDRYLFVTAVALRTVQSLAQMALVADLRNPTGKKSLVKARGVFAAYGLAEEHRGLLRLLGAAELGDEAILLATAHCRRALDEACRCRRTPFGGDNLVTVHARPSLELDVPACVAEGTGREILFWVANLHTYAMMAIDNDAPAAVASAALEVYLGDMAQLGLATLAQARARVLACRPALARMTEICDDIVARNARAAE